MLENRNLCILILNWNSHDDAIRAAKLLSGSPWDVCIVDNGSEDSSAVTSLRDGSRRLHVLETGQNLGYAGGMNFGMRWARGEGFSHVLLLNPDTTPSVDVIEGMLRASEGCAVVGTAQVTEDHTPYLSAATLRGKKVVPFQCPTSCGRGHDVDIVSGAGIMVELDVAHSLGYIDEQFFHYKEEFDFCYRVSSAGHRVRYHCGTPLIHRRGGSLSGSSPSASYYSYRNEMLFLQKHYGPFVVFSCLGLYKNAVLSMTQHPHNAKAIFRGIAHGIRGVTGPLFNLNAKGRGR